MLITTGFGYYMKNGKKISKYELEPGEHPDPEGIDSFVEVNSQEELDAIQLDKSDEQIALEQRAADLKSKRDSAKAKLLALGLTQDEIDAIIK